MARITPIIKYKDLFKGLKSEIDVAITKSIYESQQKIAPKLLYDIAQRRRFNSWTGAMAHAYVASLVMDGKHYQNVIMDKTDLPNVKTPDETIQYTVTNKTPFAYLQLPRKNMNTPIYRRRSYKYTRKHTRGRKTGYTLYRNYRFLKRFEMLGKLTNAFNEPGVYSKGSRASVYGAKRNIRARKGTTNSLNYIQIANVSQYAAMVQALGHTVIDGGRISGQGKYLRSILYNITQKNIDQAIHNYKKDFSRMHRKDKDLQYGKLYHIGHENYD